MLLVDFATDLSLKRRAIDYGATCVDGSVVVVVVVVVFVVFVFLLFCAYQCQLPISVPRHLGQCVNAWLSPCKKQLDYIFIAAGDFNGAS